MFVNVCSAHGNGHINNNYRSMTIEGFQMKNTNIVTTVAILWLLVVRLMIHVLLKMLIRLFINVRSLLLFGRIVCVNEQGKRLV